jgi:hypothetical protein
MNDKELIDAACEFVARHIWARNREGFLWFDSDVGAVASSDWLHTEVTKLITLVRENVVACQELEAEVLEEGKDAMADKFATIAAKTGKDGAK